jgi:hypothetical protein
MMISIGADFRGPELEGSAADRLITAVMKAAMECRGAVDFEAGPAINVVFHVPGSLGRPDWDGIRVATFSPKRRLLMVQVAVPANAVESPVLKDYLIRSLFGANAVAFEFFRQKGLSFPLAEAEKLVQRIKEKIDGYSLASPPQ